MVQNTECEFWINFSSERELKALKDFKEVSRIEFICTKKKTNGTISIGTDSWALRSLLIDWLNHAKYREQRSGIDRRKARTIYYENDRRNGKDRRRKQIDTPN